jgi:sRNA-binding carbon storage regulator CsrA
MLVLARKVGEAVDLGNGLTAVVERIQGNQVTLRFGEITITVLKVVGQSVKLGIGAPPERRIRRAELVDGPRARDSQTKPTGPRPPQGPGANRRRRRR